MGDQLAECRELLVSHERPHGVERPGDIEQQSQMQSHTAEQLVAADAQPVGFPEPELFQGATGQKINQLRTTYATINTAYYAPYVNANEADMGEPTDAQAVYKTLDPVMLAVLTEPNANIAQLLQTAAANVNQILANAG